MGIGLGELIALAPKEWSVYLVGFGVIFFAVTTGFPEKLGRIGHSIEQWQDRRMQRVRERDDADIAEFRRQIENLSRDLESLRARFGDYRAEWHAREERWAREWRAHREWDRAATEALLGHEPPFDVAPPIMTPDPIEETPHEHTP